MTVGWLQGRRRLKAWRSLDILTFGAGGVVANPVSTPPVMVSILAGGPGTRGYLVFLGAAHTRYGSGAGGYNAPWAGRSPRRRQPPAARVSGASSSLLIERYNPPRMREIWSDERRFELWRQVEILACE